MGHDVQIIAASTVHNSDTNLIADNTLYKKINEDGVNYILINSRNYTGNGISRIINMLDFAYKLPQVCRHFEKPDVIISTSMTMFACAEGIRIGRRWGVKTVAQITDLWPETLIAYGIVSKWNPIVLGLRYLEKWIYSRADRIIFSMEGAYDYIIEQKWDRDIVSDKVFFINNGVELESFDKYKHEYKVHDIDLLDTRFKIVYTGSIRKVNNLGLLLDAAKYLSDDYLFLIWGDGDEREVLEQRVVDEHINNVVFKGRVDKKYIPYITSQADLNIAHNTPTELFRFGISFNKIFDYMAAGKPTLSTFPCPYNPLVMYGAGKAVDVPNAHNIAKNIKYLAKIPNDEYMQYCDNARKAARIYSFENLTKKLIKILMY